MSKVEEVIEVIRSRLIKDFKPQAIIIFGSYAWGNPTETSDLDLLLIKDDVLPRRRLGVQALKILRDIDLPLDVFVYKPSEIKRKTNSFFKKIFSDGKLIYGRI